ncbi:MAG: Lon protease family protein [Candidatus Thorarchaeota archaeon]
MFEELDVEKYRKYCEPSLIRCKTTEELSPHDDIIGQERALRALSFGLEIRDKGFNVYAAGAPGTGKTTTVSAFLEDKAKEQKIPPDWCYVYNFQNPSEPNAIRLSPGWAKQLKRDIDDLIDAARKVLPEIFESEDYITRRQATTKAIEVERNALFTQLNELAQQKGFILRSSPSGLLVIPVLEGQPLSDEQIAALDPKSLESINKARQELDVELRNAMRELRKMETQVNSQLEKLNRDVALFAIGHIISDLETSYSKNEEAVKYIGEVQESILGNIGRFIEAKDIASMTPEQIFALNEFFKQYQVNIMVSNDQLDGAPVVVEYNPTYSNLFGQIEKEARFGVLSTDFTMIQPGSLHKANGGYLMIPVEDLAKTPMSYQSLKRALKNESITIEELNLVPGPIAARGLKPEPIELNVKVVLVGDTQVYDLLYSQDPDFKELFKVKAHFDTVMDRSEENIEKYASAMANVCIREGLKHLDAQAAAKVIEFSSRLADDQEKLSTRFADVSDIIREATFYATKSKSKHVLAKHIQKAIEEKIYRSNLIQERIQEMIDRGVILIDTKGEAVGQVNALSVMQFGDFSFGGPSRITASVSIGRQGIVDIERESELGGRIHTKGVMVLSGYLSRVFAQDKPLGLTARLVFEQSYSGVDGDSASSTELYALLSVLSGIPIKQSLAVTGSVNQQGQIQAIGGVNEKIEGFYEICKLKGLTGKQGVVIPESNVQNLMLKEEIVADAKKGKFHIYPVRTISEGIEVLTGHDAGLNGDGSFVDGSVFDLANKRLAEMTEKLKEYPGFDLR